MQDTKMVRNIAIVGHGNCGKTSLAEAMLYTAGKTKRLGKVFYPYVPLCLLFYKLKNACFVGGSKKRDRWTTLTLANSDIISPGYPRNYPDGVTCYYKIDAPEGMAVKLDNAKLSVPTTQLALKEE